MKDEVKRADLYLRTEFPHFVTEIFKIEGYRYQIFVHNYEGDFDKLSKQFNHSIKPVGTPATLSNIYPVKYEEKIPPIQDSEIASSFAGLPLTARDLNNLLIIKFPNIEIRHVEGVSSDKKIKVFTDPIDNDIHRQSLLAFLHELESYYLFSLIEDEEASQAVLSSIAIEEERRKKTAALNPNIARLDDSFNNPVLNLFPTKLNRHTVEFEERDETYWFEHVHEIFEGKIDKSEIIGSDLLDNCCYLDYAGFKNVNIRNGLILFDCIFVELPLHQGITYFCEDQKVTRDELMFLCKTGKLIFILTQPYFRYDYEFINEIYQVNPKAILSRRALSSLILCDLVEINNNYLLNQLDIYDSIHELSSIISEVLNLDYDSVYNLFTWPRKALRQSFECMLFGSTKRVASFGVNNIFSYLTEKLDRKDIEFEFVMNAEKVHISSALNSFYFPVFNDELYSNRASTSLMGNMMNLFKNSTEERLATYIHFHDGHQEVSPVLPAVDLIEVNEFVSVTEIEEISKHLYSGTNFKSIISFLSKLTQNERETKVNEYNRLIQTEIIKNKKTSTAIDFGLSAGLDTAGIFVPFLGTGLKSVDIVSKKLNLKNTKYLEKVRRALSVINPEKIDDRKIVPFLAKISPVARLKKDYKQ
ncbi:MAG: hypothetical protein HQ557_02435 [Bacteroidetes bacterium]|nr:hypothetical protein [Bacteroidota bacterium]